MGRRFVTVDVFTDRRFGGNPLAVVLDADGLDDVAMQAVAREFNLSETTFVLPPDDSRNDAKVRIFTPGRELPFAGHPNVGTGFVLAREAQAAGDDVPTVLCFEEAAGLVPVDILTDGDGTTSGARLTAPQAVDLGGEIPVADFAPCVGLSPTDIDCTDHPPILASAGMPFPVARLTGPDALARAHGDAAAMAARPELGGHVFVYAAEPDGPGGFRARMFAPGLGIAEDPATGGAAAALTGLLGTLQTADGRHDFRIVQGVEMGRPSVIETSVDVAGGVSGAIRVGGACVPVSRGEIDV